jgi:ketosteroid isomerase-like protein
MADSPEDILALAKRFFDAIEEGDIDTMYNSFAPGAPIWHNTDELIVTPDQTKATLAGMVKRITNRKYAERRVHAFPGGFVQQHALTGNRTHDGEAVRLPCAIVCAVENGKITRLDEYFDSAHVAQFRKFADA